MKVGDAYSSDIASTKLKGMGDFRPCCGLPSGTCRTDFQRKLVRIIAALRSATIRPFVSAGAETGAHVVPTAFASDLCGFG